MACIQHEKYARKSKPQRFQRAAINKGNKKVLDEMLELLQSDWEQLSLFHETLHFWMRETDFAGTKSAFQRDRLTM